MVIVMGLGGLPLHDIIRDYNYMKMSIECISILEYAPAIVLSLGKQIFLVLYLKVYAHESLIQMNLLLICDSK